VKKLAHAPANQAAASAWTWQSPLESTEHFPIQNATVDAELLARNRIFLFCCDAGPCLPHNHPALNWIYA
jgi:hypothetical protein